MQVEGYVDRLECDAVDRTHKELLALRDRIEVEGRPERTTIAGWAAEVGTLAVKCRTRQDLARVRLDITGITLGETVTQESVDPRIFLFGRIIGPVEPVTVVMAPYARA